ERDPGYTRRCSPGSVEQGGMRNRSSFGEKGCYWYRRQLWSWRDDVPRRRELRRSVEHSHDDEVYWWKFWPPDWRPGHRLCHPGDECQGENMMKSKLKLGAD